MFDALNEKILEAKVHAQIEEVDNIGTKFSSTLIQGLNRGKLGFC
jgi:hypothetical protein